MPKNNKINSVINKERLLVSDSTRAFLVGLAMVLVSLIAFVEPLINIGRVFSYIFIYLFGLLYPLFFLILLSLGLIFMIKRRFIKIKFNITILAFILIVFFGLIALSDYSLEFRSVFKEYGTRFSSLQSNYNSILTSKIGGGMIGFFFFSMFTSLVGTSITRFIYLIGLILMAFLVLKPIVYYVGEKIIHRKDDYMAKEKKKKEMRERQFSQFFDSDKNFFLDEKEELRKYSTSIKVEEEEPVHPENSFYKKNYVPPREVKNSGSKSAFNIFKDNPIDLNNDSISKDIDIQNTNALKSTGKNFNIFKDNVIEDNYQTNETKEVINSKDPYDITKKYDNTQGGVFASSQSIDKKIANKEKVVEVIDDFYNGEEKIGNNINVNERKTSESIEKVPDVQVNNPIIENELDENITHNNSESVAKKSKRKNYHLPGMNLLDEPIMNDVTKNKEAAQLNVIRLNNKFQSLGIKARVINFITAPSFTRFEIDVDSDVKVSQFNQIKNDIMMAVSAEKINILTPIPGKSYVGIEIPNVVRSNVSFKEVIGDIPFSKKDEKLLAAIGKDVTGQTIVFEINKTPHLLIAGATGAGKSVCMNTIIVSLLMRATPDEVKLMIIDPKRVEMSAYANLPHLICPVITDSKKAAVALGKVVELMEKRYELFEKCGKKNIELFNSSADDLNEEKLPYLVVIVDELADLMLIAQGAVEESIRRITQLARAVGIHMIVATQRPSVDVITGVIKANIPSRIAFAVASQIDSRTILDEGGAEELLGKGDMFANIQGYSPMQRVQGAFVKDEEIDRIVEFICRQGSPEYDQEFMNLEPNASSEQMSFSGEGFSDSSADEFYKQILEFLQSQNSVSVSYLQRKFTIGFPKAARIIDRLEEEGFVGPPNGSKPREVYCDSIRAFLNQ